MCVCVYVFGGGVSNTCVAWLAQKKMKSTSGLWPRSGPKLWTQGAQRGLRKTAARNQIDKKQAHTYTLIHKTQQQPCMGGVAVCEIRVGEQAVPRTRRNDDDDDVRRAFILKFDVVANKHRN